mmetsp:Transcript_132798/g.234959  ORF Transcript_132798/g.234959 Transcript_132798/m.234959 type:complete len:257 (+) Transcript_132798:134-904(+)
MSGNDTDPSDLVICFLLFPCSKLLGGPRAKSRSLSAPDLMPASSCTAKFLNICCTCKSCWRLESIRPWFCLKSLSTFASSLHALKWRSKVMVFACSAARSMTLLALPLLRSPKAPSLAPALFKISAISLDFFSSKYILLHALQHSYTRPESLDAAILLRMPWVCWDFPFLNSCTFRSASFSASFASLSFRYSVWNWTIAWKHMVTRPASEADPILAITLLALSICCADCLASFSSSSLTFAPAVLSKIAFSLSSLK